MHIYLIFELLYITRYEKHSHFYYVIYYCRL